MNSREEREKLKEEYKEHYRSILESRKKLASYERKAKIAKALEQMNPAPVMDSLQNAMDSLREKMIRAEARFEAYLDGEEEALASAQKKEKAETFTAQSRAKDTVSAIRAEMGRIEEELENNLQTFESDKTISPGDKNTSDDSGDHGRISADIKKTIGPAGRDNENG